MECGYSKCKSQNITTEWKPEREQYLKRCADCGKSTWDPKEGSKNREASHRQLVKKSGITKCEHCGIDEHLIPHPQKLEAHHIIEYDEGGTDDMQNILIVCTECHKEIHHKRTYRKHYINKLIKL